MLVLAAVAVVSALAGGLAWIALARWSPDPGAPRIRRETIAEEVRAHPHARSWLQARTDPEALTGLALSMALVIMVAGFAVVGVLVLMVRSHTGFADWDQAAARFGARHATALSTRALRGITQLGGAVLLVPVAAVFGVLSARRQHAGRAIVAFLAVCVGGQFLLSNLVKLGVDRARPDFSRLTGFSGSSFPSGHATAAAATLAAIALIAGRGRSRAARAALGGVAVALTVAVAASRVLLGVHWFTDVVAGMALGWAWFALCSVAFGGRLLTFGAPAATAEDVSASSPPG